MSRIRPSSVLFGLLVLSPALAFAAPYGQTPPPSKTSAPKAAPAPAVHATNGVVKSVDATSLVITRPSGKDKEMTFVLNTSTQTKGTVAVGSAVEVRYKTMGKDNVASAVTVQVKKK
jgi:hypothetical protein